VLAAEARKAGIASEDTATVFDWKTGLNPLNIGEVRIGDELNRMSE